MSTHKIYFCREISKIIPYQIPTINSLGGIKYCYVNSCTEVIFSGSEFGAWYSLNVKPYEPCHEKTVFFLHM